MATRNLFTRREQQIVALLKQGKSNKQIALELTISQRTVEYHITNILAKLNVSSRTEAVIKLSEANLRESASQSGQNLRESTVTASTNSSENVNVNEFNALRRISMKRYFFAFCLLVLILLVLVFCFANGLYRTQPPETQNAPLPGMDQQPTSSYTQTTQTSDTLIPTKSTEPTLRQTRTPIQPSTATNTANPLSATLDTYPWPTVISPVFPGNDDIYLRPLPLLFGAWPATAGCPNPQGLEDYASLLPESVVDILQRLSTSDQETLMQWSDPAYWPVGINPFAGQDITQDWIKEKARVSESSFASQVTAQCGEEIMKLSWWVQVCPGPCQANSSESLNTNIFLINRMQWLIWTME